MSPAVCDTTETNANFDGHIKPAKPLDPMAAMGHGRIALEEIPDFDTFAGKRQWTLEHLAGAFRVFGREGYAEGIAGHISVRDPEFSDRFWINPLAVHFSMMRVSDLICLDMKGNVVGGNRVMTLQLPLDKHQADSLVHSCQRSWRLHSHSVPSCSPRCTCNLPRALNVR